jgi:hypothetical protein
MIHRLTRVGTPRLVVTAAANLGSSYALEGVSALFAAAFSLADPLRHAAGPALALAIIASYLAWTAGLALNAHGNWLLLERESVSVSITSKLLHDEIKRLGGNQSIRYGATAFGFVVWEAAKEAPWLLATFGIEATSRGHHGWSFLAGSNIGAMAYNLAQGAVIQRLVRARPAKSR